MTLRVATGTTAVVAALLLAPTAAVATTAVPDAEVTLSGATSEEVTMAAGERLSAHVDGPGSTSEITLTVSSSDVPDSAIAIAGAIAGVDVQGTSGTTDADADGDATFSITLSAEGDYALEAVDQDGEPLGSATVVVQDGGTLPETGVGDSTMAALGTAALLLGSGGALVIARRRAAA